MSQWTHSLPAKVGALLLTFLFICLAGGACVGIVCAWNMQIYDGANAYPVDAAAAEQYDISCYFSSDICRSTAFEAAHRAMRMLKNGRAAQKIDQELSLQSTNLHLAIFDEQGKLLSATDQAVWLAAEHNLRWIDTDGLAGYLRAQPPNQADLSEEGTEPAAPDHQAADQLAETLIPRGTVLLTIIDRLEEDSRLFAMLPYKSLCFTGIKDRHGVYAMIGKDERRDVSIRRPRPSIRKQLTDSKQAASPKKAAARTKKKELEV